MHQHRALQLRGTDHLWAPTTWAVLPDDVTPVLGTKRCGLLALEFDDDGHVESRMVEPDGLAQLALRRDIPDPYRH